MEMEKKKMMKRILTVFIAAVFSLCAGAAFAQSDNSADDTAWADEVIQEAQAANENAATPAPLPAPNTDKEADKKKKGVIYPYRRYVEFGVEADVGFANNFLGVGDVLQKNITVNLKEIGDKINDNGMDLNFELGTKVFLNVNLTETWGFDLFSTVAGSINGNIPKSIFTLASEGNLKSHSSSGDITAFGGVFADANVDVHARILQNKLKISVIPSMFVPLVYIPKSGFHYDLQADGTLKVSGGGQIDVYSPVSLENIQVSDISSALDAKGFDLSLNGEYRLFDFLDVGAMITHIPLVAATLNNKMSVSLKDGTIVNGEDLISKIKDGLGEIIDSPDLKYSHTKGEIAVRRPLRFDIYADYKPFKSKLVVIRPKVGLTTLTPEETPRFNATLKAELNTAFFLLHLGTGYDELLWRHSLMLGFNLRVFELDIGVNLRSQDFVKSFSLNGAGAFVGVRFGF
jgi:hypothetical protein